MLLGLKGFIQFIKNPFDWLHKSLFSSDYLFQSKSPQGQDLGFEIHVQDIIILLKWFVNPFPFHNQLCT